MNTKFVPLLKLNLQHFAEGEAQQTQQTQQTQNVDIDGIVSGISSRLNETLNQRLSPIEQKMNQPAPLTQEQIEEQKEQRRQLFEDDPIAYENSIREQAKKDVLGELDPIIQEFKQATNKSKWQDTVRQFVSTNPEAQKHMGAISQVLQENPAMMNTKQPLENAYKMAIANNIIGNGGNVVQGVLSNEEYRQQILENPEIYQAVVQKYQQGLNDGSQKGIPPLMGNNQSGSIPASGGSSPINLKEAKQASLRRLQGI